MCNWDTKDSAHKQHLVDQPAVQYVALAKSRFRQTLLTLSFSFFFTSWCGQCRRRTWRPRARPCSTSSDRSPTRRTRCAKMKRKKKKKKKKKEEEEEEQEEQEEAKRRDCDCVRACVCAWTAYYCLIPLFFVFFAILLFFLILFLLFAITCRRWKCRPSSWGKTGPWKSCSPTRRLHSRPHCRACPPGLCRKSAWTHRSACPSKSKATDQEKKKKKKKKKEEEEEEEKEKSRVE